MRAWRLIEEWSVIRRGILTPASTLLYHHLTMMHRLHGGAGFGGGVDWFSEILVSMCKYGPSRYGELDARLDALVGVQQHHFLSPSHPSPPLPAAAEEEEEELLFSNSDFLVRVQACTIFALIPSEEGIKHQLLLHLLNELDRKEYRGKEREREKENYNSTLEKVYPDSQIHREGVRCWQGVHVLLDVLLPPPSASLLFTRVWGLLSIETVTDTMSMIEWILIRLLLAHPSTLLPLLHSLAMKVDDKAHQMTSILLIYYHMVVTMEWSENRRSAIRSSFHLSLVWMSNKNFNTRVLAQRSLCSLWDLIEGEGEEEVLVKEYFYLKDIVHHLRQSKQVLKSFRKCEEYHFYSRAFHPLKSIHAEFLFKGWWDVVGLGVDERISSDAFYKLRMELEEERSGDGEEEDVRWYLSLGYHHRGESRRVMRESKRPDGKESVLYQASMVKKNGSVEEEEEEEEGGGGGGGEARGAGPMQRKLVGWEQIMKSDIEFSNYRSPSSSKPRNTLQIVAVLLNKPANLGGLCRTCETFNAGLLVLDNLQIMKDPLFLSTAVTADRWMPVKEVKEEGLEAYLLDQKKLGWALIGKSVAYYSQEPIFICVGIEQATQSVSLEKFTFPPRSCLVLGREREGIPANVLLLMDSIIEIPQFGMIKSLNVHVSGSIILWEYLKQHLS